jgi:hypothetical protein
MAFRPVRLVWGGPHNLTWRDPPPNGARQALGERPSAGVSPSMSVGGVPVFQDGMALSPGDYVRVRRLVSGQDGSPLGSSTGPTGSAPRMRVACMPRGDPCDDASRRRALLTTSQRDSRRCARSPYGHRSRRPGTERQSAIRPMGLVLGQQQPTHEDSSTRPSLHYAHYSYSDCTARTAKAPESDSVSARWVGERRKCSACRTR